VARGIADLDSKAAIVEHIFAGTGRETEAVYPFETSRT
jgi:hypothetical protein